MIYLLQVSKEVVVWDEEFNLAKDVDIIANDVVIHFSTHF